MSVGTVDTLDVIHIQCHIGFDTISLARRGARVTGLDFPSVGAGGASALELRADAPSRALVVSGEPIREPVVAYGPFVMNTEDEIIQAYRDFHTGKFGGPTPASR